MNDDCSDMSEWIDRKKKTKNSLTANERHELVSSCVPLCCKIVREHYERMAFAGRHEDIEELNSEAFLACVEASRYYDASTGNRFTTMVGEWVRLALVAYSNRNKGPRIGELSHPEIVPNRDEQTPDDLLGVEIDARQAILLAQLDEPDKSIAILCVFAHQSPCRVADRLGIPVKDVKLRMNNIAVKLCAFLASYVDDSENSIFATHTHEE